MNDKMNAGETEAKTAEKAAPKRGVGTVAMEAILAHKTNEEALEAVRKEFPDANTTLSSINWYRNKARTDGMKGADGKPVLSARELKKAANGGDTAKTGKTGKAGKAGKGKDAATSTAAAGDDKGADPTA